MTWSLFFLVPTGRGKAEDEVSPAEYEAVMHFLYDCSKYISAKTTEGHHYKRVVLQRAILDEKGLNVEDYFDLHPIYFHCADQMQLLWPKIRARSRVENFPHPNAHQCRQRLCVYLPTRRCISQRLYAGFGLAISEKNHW
jgi:MoaA/NifB/PqqE/SkfB family radical SAM enzyme